MPSFSFHFDQRKTEVERTIGAARLPSAGRVEELLAKSLSERLSLRELAELLETGRHPEAEGQFQALRAFVLHRFRKPGGNRLRYIVPIYLSNYCVDTCGYCNFSSRRDSVLRKRLSIEDLEREMAAVMAAGPRVIELVLGTDPWFTPAELERYVAKTAEILRGEAGSAVLLCSDYLPERAYAALRDAGLWGMVQWDETLDPAAYRRWHSSSPRKQHFEERMDNHDRAMAAGLEAATGALFGLADYRYEVLMQVGKTRHLEEEYGLGAFVFGTARLKPIGGREIHPATEVGERAYETALMVYQIADPAAGRWLQTRETFETNLRNMLDGDAFTLRCGEVRPGGYSNGGSALPASRPGGQFAVHELTREEVEARLRTMNFEIEYSWTPFRQAPAHADAPAATA